MSAIQGSAALDKAGPSILGEQFGPDTDLLLDYQQHLLDTTARSQVVICEKSRRIGFTWAIAADAVLTAASQKSAGGMDVYYIAYDKEMTREFIDTCAQWARLFDKACSVAEEVVFDDSPDNRILAFRITFASGYEVVALSSRPRNLRGRQGYVIIDEAAFHDDLEEVMKAALALLIWGGKVLVISTHNGVDNYYNQLVTEARTRKKPYELITVTFDQALADGLYRRICMISGTDWSLEAEAKWRQGIIDFYGDGADEELFCIPRNSGGKYIPLTLIEARAKPDIPVLRWSCDDSYVHLSDHVRHADCLAWCERELRPLLLALPQDRRSYFGQDFGRSGDLTVIWPLLLMPNLQRHTPALVELRNVPFRQQEQILFYIADRLPRFTHGALDARGNGQSLAEVAMQRYGTARISQVMLTERIYGEAMPKFKAALDDDQLDLMADELVRDDLRAIEVIRGVPRIPDNTKQGDRHGDSAVAGMLAWHASLQEGAPIEFKALGQVRSSSGIGDYFGGGW